MRKALLVAAGWLLALPAFAHVTPNVTLVRHGDFVKQSFPENTSFFEKVLRLEPAEAAAIQASTGWSPSDEEARVYVGRNDRKELLGTVIFVWMPSQHGPVGVGVAFDAEGSIRQATVTDVGSEPLNWVRPLLQAEGMAALSGLSQSTSPDPSRIGPGVTGNMSRYYAKVIADGVARAQALERLVRSRPRG
jgi:hypothetical protein